MGLIAIIKRLIIIDQEIKDNNIGIKVWKEYTRARGNVTCILLIFLPYYIPTIECNKIVYRSTILLIFYHRNHLDY